MSSHHSQCHIILTALTHSQPRLTHPQPHTPTASHTHSPASHTHSLTRPQLHTLTAQPHTPQLHTLTSAVSHYYSLMHTLTASHLHSTSFTHSQYTASHTHNAHQIAEREHHNGNRTVLDDGTDSKGKRGESNGSHRQDKQKDKELVSSCLELYIGDIITVCT